jgi:hypothetical protein
MTITDLLKTASFEERRVIEAACIAAQSNKKPIEPKDQVQASLFWRAYAIAGGKKLPKAEPKPRPRPRPGDDEIIVLRGFDRYKVRRAGGKPTPAELLRATLNDEAGRKIVRHVMETIDKHLDQTEDMTIGVQYAIEAARWSWHGAGMKGEFKVDNDIASAISRWASFCWPNRYAHRIEMRGTQPPASTWPWINPERPYEPLWRGPAGEPVPALFDVNAAY